MFSLFLIHTFFYSLGIIYFTVRNQLDHLETTLQWAFLFQNRCRVNKNTQNIHKVIHLYF